MNMNIFKMALAVCLGLATACAAAAEPSPEAMIRKVLEPQLEEGVKIESVTRTPYAGLYEVRTSTDIIYTDANAKFVFLGHIIDTRTRQDITKARIEDITKVRVQDMPLDLALKMVKGDGKRVIAIFEDPNCGYCKRFRQTLQEMDNLTVYTFMYNILAEDSVVKSRNIWCSANPVKAWDDWMLAGKEAPAAPESCVAPSQKVFQFGRRLQVTGTPTVFFADGTRISGAMDAKTLESKLANVKLR